MFGQDSNKQSDTISSNIFQSPMMTKDTTQIENKMIFGGNSIFQTAFTSINSNHSVNFQPISTNCSVGMQPSNSTLFFNLRNKNHIEPIFPHINQNSTTTLFGNNFQTSTNHNAFNKTPIFGLSSDLISSKISSSFLTNNYTNQSVSYINSIFSQSSPQVYNVFSQVNMPSKFCTEIFQPELTTGIIKNTSVERSNFKEDEVNTKQVNKNVFSQNIFLQNDQQELESTFKNISNASNIKDETSLFSISTQQNKIEPETGSFLNKDIDNKKFIKQQLSNNINEYSSLVVREIPLQYLNNEILKQHFSKFGIVSKIYLNMKSNSANVHFNDHASAKRAKENGENIDSTSAPLKIFWKAESSKKVTNVNNKISATIVEPIKEMKNLNESVKNLKALPLEIYNSLKSLVNTVAVNATDRFEVLDQRDKILKSINAVKQSNLSEAVIVEGICMDMCPEKERYMRQDRRRLTIYETIPSTDLPGQNPQVDHSRAVKEYSRSSADQDMPLPEELRPVDVLDRTMDYLLNYIVDTGNEETWSEWYNFLWDRMRSIRKDITQQHLCDEVVVSLVEKSARFHIICSQLLCEEDVSIFDMKINDENLTKCLQTLKEMYQDLASKNILCENESEFASYKILMNLNEGDIIYEAQQWSSEIRHSDEVQRSLQIYGAVNSNNFIRFFRLADTADYITASIMHRYFYQMRTIALQRIIRSYSTFRDPSLFPLEDLVRMLGFDNKIEASNFVSYFGLGVQGDYLIIDKNRFLLPESAIPAKKSHKLVESKRRSLLSEAINGKPLTEFYFQMATSSFDEQNHLTLNFIENLLSVNQMQATVPQVNNNQMNISSNLSQLDSLFTKQVQSTVSSHSMHNNLPLNQMQGFFPNYQFTSESSLNQDIKNSEIIVAQNFNHFGKDQIIVSSIQSRTNSILTQIGANNPIFGINKNIVYSQDLISNLDTQLKDTVTQNQSRSINPFNIYSINSFNPSSQEQPPRYENTTGVNLFSGFQEFKKNENSVEELTKPQLQINAEVMKSLAKDLFLEVISEVCLSLGQEVLENSHRKLLFIKIISDGYITADIGCFIREICHDCINCALISQKQEIFIDSIVSQSFFSILDDIIYDEIKSHKDKMHLENILSKISDILFKEVITDESTMFAKKYHHINVACTLHQLNFAQQHFDLFLLRQWLHKWKGKLEIKLYIDSFPCMPNLLFSNYRNNIPFLSPDKIKLHREQLYEGFDEINSNQLKEYIDTEEPIQLFRLFNNNLLQNITHAEEADKELYTRNIYWKLLICLPKENFKIRNWILKKFNSQYKDTKEAVILNNQFDCHLNTKIVSLNICVLLEENIFQISNEQLRGQHMSGISATLFILEATDISFEICERERQRFKDIMKYSEIGNKIIVIAPCCLTKNNIYDILDVVDDSIITDIIQCDYNNFSNLNENLLASLNILINYSTRIPHLFADNIASMFYDLLTHFFFNKYLTYFSIGDDYNYMVFEHLILKYNSMLNIISHYLIQEADDLFWPAVEFKGSCKSTSKIFQIKSSTEMLMFPIEKMNINGTVSDYVWPYIEILGDRYPQININILISKINLILEKSNVYSCNIRILFLLFEQLVSCLLLELSKEKEIVHACHLDVLTKKLLEFAPEEYYSLNYLEPIINLNKTNNVKKVVTYSNVNKKLSSNSVKRKKSTMDKEISSPKIKYKSQRLSNHFSIQQNIYKCENLLMNPSYLMALSNNKDKNLNSYDLLDEGNIYKHNILESNFRSFDSIKNCDENLVNESSIIKYCSKIDDNSNFLEKINQTNYIKLDVEKNQSLQHTNDFILKIDTEKLLSSLYENYLISCLDCNCICSLNINSFKDYNIKCIACTNFGGKAENTKLRPLFEYDNKISSETQPGIKVDSSDNLIEKDFNNDIDLFILSEKDANILFERKLKFLLDK